MTDPVNSWLSTFDLSFDEIATHAVCEGGENLYSPDPAATPRLAYEPQLYDALLRSAGTLLDRCLAYRREMGEFEVAGVKAALDYLAFLKLSPITRNLDDLSIQDDRAIGNYSMQQKAGQVFGKGTDVIDKGLAVQALGSADDALKFFHKEQARRAALHQKSDLIRDAQLALFTRYISPGTAYNYAERYLRLKSLLAEDIAEAYQKIFCAAAGIYSVLDISKLRPLSGNSGNINVLIPRFRTSSITDGTVSLWVKGVIPEVNSRAPDILDAFVLWTRQAMREIEKRAQYEIEQSFSIPLNQRWTSTGGHDILTDKQISDAMDVNGSGTVSFQLPIDSLPFSANLRAIRIIGIGLTVTHAQEDAYPTEYLNGYPSAYSDAEQQTKRTLTGAATEAKRARLNATVQLPAQKSAFQDTYSRPPIFLANVRLQGGTSGELEPDITTDPGCRNANPFGQTWSISFDKRSILWYASASEPGTRSWVTGLILHLRIRALPDGYGV
ncbi:hypothetical protein [Burkholderia sp. MSMB1826]|uniref:hypothetical protein n=1 Tax=Burkholderia sp. MSMB1826 TaxID=1637875 RepID=UPI0012E3DC4C|nr:hypothetical protein [Burkholderia sp. MSMB1826]